MKNHYEVIEKYLHQNGNGVPFVVAIVDDMNEHDTKLVIMFEDEDFTAVFSLDTLIESEDITPEGNSYDGEIFDRELREELWSLDYNEDDEDEDEW
jgi:hypothetical protein